VELSARLFFYYRSLTLIDASAHQRPIKEINAATQFASKAGFINNRKSGYGETIVLY